MRTFELTCTEPGRWDRTPDAEAPASEILAFLQHCEACAYHTQLAREEDRPLDRLLRDASRALVVDDVALPGVATEPEPAQPLLVRLRRIDRAPAARYRRERASFERRLTQACMMAFGVVVLFTSFTAYPFDRSGPAEAVVAVAEAPIAPVAPAPEPAVLTIDAEAISRLYFTRVVSADYDRQFMQTSRERPAAEIPDYDVGSILLLTNPISGASVEVEILRRSYRDHEILLSVGAAAVLGLDSTAVVVVQERPNPSAAQPNLAP